ncbi:hypothetical protein HHX47_DHR2001109 [Lentinula edodes]|nr:hypothetical protein HHX47_DHR2001109 [Lentinula edodes]
MPLQPKRSLPWSENECDEDSAAYTKVRRIGHNGRYEDEVEFLRLRNAELEARVHELEDDLEKILNQEMDDVASLKEDVHLYYRQYRDSQLEVMELEEVIFELRESGNCNQFVTEKPEDEVRTTWTHWFWPFIKIGSIDKRGFFTPTFIEEVAAWWASLQPQWRLLDENGTPTPFDSFGDDMSPLNKHGRNAWVGLLACIKWWGIGLKCSVADDHEVHLNEWLNIIADMTKMLGKLAAD